MKSAQILWSLLAAALTGRARAMSPEQMLSAPRRSEAIPSPDGSLAIFSQSVYNFTGHEKTTTWHLMRVGTGEVSKLPYNGTEVEEIWWVGDKDSSILYVNGTNEETPGGVTLWMSDALNPSSTSQVGALGAAYSGLRAVKTASGDITFVVNSLAYPNGTAYNEETAEPVYSTGMLYESIYIRHWDAYLTQQRYAVFSGKLTKNSKPRAYSNMSSSPYTLASPQLTNLLAGINATVTRPETPVQPFGGSTDYDLSPDGRWVAFLTKAPELPKANYTASYIYIVPSDGSSPPVSINGPGTGAQARGHLGASAAPKFSPDGKYLAYAQMDGVAYESDRAKIYVAGLRPEGGLSSWNEVAGDWDRSANSMQWSPDGSMLWVASDDLGSTKLFPVPRTAEASFKPKNATSHTSSVTATYILKDGRALVSVSGVHTSTSYYLVDSNGGSTPVLEAYKIDPELQGLSPDTVSEFYYTGSLGVPVQSFVIKPSNYDSSRVYPLAFLVHGGPQSPWSNAWSTRWNFQVWADQGYIVVAPNPTGSIGFGQQFVDAIQNNWGSYPYDDLVACWNYVAANMSDVNVERGIEAGASYGGYMTNWIQGHDLGRKFKALVTHDGSTSTLAQYGSEELWFMQHDFNGTLWNDRPNYERWDPIAHAVNFSTPHFVIHSDKDYRLPISEGMTLFNVLQERGIPSRFLTFPDENHWVLDPENSRMWHKEVFNWVNHYSGVGGPLNDDPITN